MFYYIAVVFGIPVLYWSYRNKYKVLSFGFSLASGMLNGYLTLRRLMIGRDQNRIKLLKEVSLESENVKIAREYRVQLENTSQNIVVIDKELGLHDLDAVKRSLKNKTLIVHCSIQDQQENILYDLTNDIGKLCLYLNVDDTQSCDVETLLCLIPFDVESAKRDAKLVVYLNDDSFTPITLNVNDIMKETLANIVRQKY